MTVIGAHFAGWSMWEDATRQLAGRKNLYVDLSSSLYALSPETANELIHAYGTDKVLWGTDYPMWESESEMEYFNKIDLTDEERSMILYENAFNLLKRPNIDYKILKEFDNYLKELEEELIKIKEISI